MEMGSVEIFYNVMGFVFFGFFVYIVFFNPQISMFPPQTILAMFCGLVVMIMFANAEIKKVKKEVK